MDAIEKANERIQFGRLLKIARCRANLTQHQVAEMVGCSQAAVSDYENGHYWPSPAIQSQLKNILNLNMPEFDE